MPKQIPNPCESPEKADERFLAGVESLLSSPADKAMLIILSDMRVKAHALAARRDAMDEIGSKFLDVSTATH